MDFLLKVGYYGVSVAVFGLFFLGNLFSNANPGDTWVHKTILLVSGLTGIGFLVWSILVGHQGGQWALGIGLAVSGVVLFVVLMVAGMLTFTSVNWR
jgi:hypothetical protein